MSSVIRRRSGVVGVLVWMFMRNSRADRGRITSTDTTALSAGERRQRRRLTRLTAKPAAYREAI
jgi:hypothetical protein